MQVAGGEAQSAGVGVVPVREQQVTYFVYGSFVPELWIWSLGAIMILD